MRASNERAARAHSRLATKQFNGPTSGVEMGLTPGVRAGMVRPLFYLNFRETYRFGSRGPGAQQAGELVPGAGTGIGQATYKGMRHGSRQGERMGKGGHRG